MLNGIDVSTYQGEINWDLAAEYAGFAIIRAGSINNYYGTCYKDWRFDRNSALAPELLPVAYYWFFRANHDPIKQADFFADLVAGKEYAFLVCDIETAGSAYVVRQFCERLAAKTGAKVAIYTSPHAWDDLLSGDKNWAIDYLLWIAHWDTLAPVVPQPWDMWDAWQYKVGTDGKAWGMQSSGLDHDWAMDELFIPPPAPTLDLVKLRTLLLALQGNNDEARNLLKEARMIVESA
jgi:GH25 family lysozyme M1 (1,4-beta-N-acetylmuramidase)